jgi:hypothetical protein
MNSAADALSLELCRVICRHAETNEGLVDVLQLWNPGSGVSGGS